MAQTYRTCKSGIWYKTGLTKIQGAFRPIECGAHICSKRSRRWTWASSASYNTSWKKRKPARCSPRNRSVSYALVDKAQRPSPNPFRSVPFFTQVVTCSRGFSPAQCSRGRHHPCWQMKERPWRSSPAIPELDWWLWRMTEWLASVTWSVTRSPVSDGRVIKRTWTQRQQASYTSLYILCTSNDLHHPLSWR